MKLIATRDVPEEPLRQFRDDLSPDFEIDIDGGRVALLSLEPPSWIHFIAQADWWIQALAAYSALYVAELVKAAAKDTWQARGKLISGIAHAGTRLRKIADAFAALRGRLRSKTELVIGLPIPDEHIGSHLTLTAPEPDHLAAEIALFVHYIPALNEFIETEGLNQKKPATGIFLCFQPSGDLEVAWFDATSLEKQQRVLSLTEPPKARV